MSKASYILAVITTCILFCVAVVSFADTSISKKEQKETVTGIVFNGKLYCPLRRQVGIPFPGVFTDILVVPGQWVKKGEILAQYTIDESRALQIGRDIFFNESTKLRRYLETEKLKLFELEKNEGELQKLTSEDLSPQYTLKRLRKEIEIVRKYVSYLETQFTVVRKFEKRKLEHIRDVIGNSSLKPGQIPDVVTLRAPIDGVVLLLHPQLKKYSQLPEGTIVAEIGKMDNLLIRSLVYEKDVVHLNPGYQVDFFPDSFPGEKLPATISSINWVPNTQNPELPSYYQVEMTIENESLRLRPGFKGYITFQQNK